MKTSKWVVLIYYTQAGLDCFGCRGEWVHKRQEKVSLRERKIRKITVVLLLYYRFPLCSL